MCDLWHARLPTWLDALDELAAVKLVATEHASARAAARSPTLNQSYRDGARWTRDRSSTGIARRSGARLPRYSRPACSVADVIVRALAPVASCSAWMTCPSASTWRRPPRSLPQPACLYTASRAGLRTQERHCCCSSDPGALAHAQGLLACLGQMSNKVRQHVCCAPTSSHLRAWGMHPLATMEMPHA